MNLRVLSYNIWEGGGGRLDAIGAMIRSQDPDVVALLEANDRRNAEMLSSLLGMHLVFGEAGTGPYHVAWLSRLPVSRSVNHRDPGLAKTLLEIEVVVAGQSVILLAAHLGSRSDRQQPEGEVPILMNVLQRAAGTPHALVGDLNALREGDPVGQPPDGKQPWGGAAAGASRPALRPLLTAGYVDCYRVLHPRAPGYTYPAHHPWLRLDYVFASPELAHGLHTCEVVGGNVARQASDHFPVRAAFRLLS